MKLILNVILLLSALGTGLVKFIFLIQSNLWYLIPFAGCLVGLGWLFKGMLFVAKNANKLAKFGNAIQNLTYVLQCNNIKADDPKVKEFVRKFSAEPKDFQANF